MKRWMTNVALVVLLVAATVGAAIASANKVSAFAQQTNQQKTALVQQRLDETLALLEDLTQDDYIRSHEVGFQEKAGYLADQNIEEDHGYMMIRILDEEVNLYRKNVGVTSNLASRDYMQRTYATGTPQVTDAFLAGADGKTINYTIAVPIVDDDKVMGAVFVAIYGTEIDGLLQDDGSENVLVGSALQYMGGIGEEQFGLTVEQVLESEITPSRPLESILLDFTQSKSGSFWGYGGGIRRFVYSPVEHADWMVMTEVRLLPLIQNIVILHVCCILALIAAAVLLNRRKATKQEAEG